MAMKAISDEKLAKFVEGKVKEIDNYLLATGSGISQAMSGMEKAIQAQIELKEALRFGQFQPSLPFDKSEA